MSKVVVPRSEDKTNGTPSASQAPEPATFFEALRQSVVKGELRVSGVPLGGMRFCEWPCPEFLTEPGDRIDLARMPTEIVGHGDSPRYPGSRVIFSKHTNKEARHSSPGGGPGFGDCCPCCMTNARGVF